MTVLLEFSSRSEEGFEDYLSLDLDRLRGMLGADGLGTSLALGWGSLYLPLSVCLPICLICVCAFICLSPCLCLSVSLSVSLSVLMSHHHIFDSVSSFSFLVTNEV